MARSTLIILLGIFFCVFTKAQTADSKYWLSVGYNNNQYGSILESPFDNLLSVDAFSVSIGVDRYLGKSFDIGANISFGKVMNLGVSRANTFGAQVMPRFKFNNGKILSDSSRLSPYVAMGLGLYNISNSSISEENDTFLTLSPTVGLKYNLFERSSVWVATSYKINNTFRYREYSIGMNFSLKKKSDRDKDGIPDRKDNCPDEFGTPEYQGCAVSQSPADPVEERQPDVTDPQRNTDQRPVNADTTTRKPVGQPVEKVEPEKPVDTDLDGIPDAEDQCPNEAGSAANNGCPVVTTPVETPAPVVEEPADIYTLPLDAVSFNRGTNQISRADIPLLDELAELMARDESFKLELNGYGDRGNDATTNFQLAARRVDAVVNYLVSKGRSRYRFIKNILSTPREAGTSGKVLIKVIE